MAAMGQTALRGAGGVTELNFKGKEFVYNHHLAVPFRPLVPHAGKGIGPVAMDGKKRQIPGFEVGGSWCFRQSEVNACIDRQSEERKRGAR